MTADEFFDVYRIFRPEASKEEFAVAWDRFQKAKAEHLRKTE